MTLKVQLKVEGLGKLRQMLLTLPDEVQSKTVRSAVNAGAKLIQEAARQKAPVRTGRLRRAIYRKFLSRESSRVQKSFIVGVFSGRRYKRRNLDAHYWRYMEFGTSKLPPRPFLRPAFDQNAERAILMIREKLGRGIELAVERLKRITASKK